LKSILPPQTTVISELHTGRTSVCSFPSAEQTSSLQVVLESSNNEDRPAGNGECHSTDASWDAAGSDSNVTRSNSSRMSHGAAHFMIPSQVACQGTGVANVYDSDMAM
jgi:hypothetical protein